MAKIKSEGGQAANQRTVYNAQQAARASIQRGEAVAKAKRAGAQSVKVGTVLQATNKQRQPGLAKLAKMNHGGPPTPGRSEPHPISARGGAKVSHPVTFKPNVKLDASQVTDRRRLSGVPKRK